MIQINASSRLKEAITAATAADAGKVVLWVQKAIPQAKGKKHGRAGKAEGMDFKAGKGGNAIVISVLLDHAYEPPRLLLEGSGGGEKWSAEESTGRKTIMAFKQQLKDSVAVLGDSEDHAILVTYLKALIKARSKVE